MSAHRPAFDLDADDVDVRPYRARGRQVVGCGHVVEAGSLLFEATSSSSVATLCRSCVDAVGHVVRFGDGPAVW